MKSKELCAVFDLFQFSMNSFEILISSRTCSASSKSSLDDTFSPVPSPGQIDFIALKPHANDPSFSEKKNGNDLHAPGLMG